jgi:hypothetical protein
MTAEARQYPHLVRLTLLLSNLLAMTASPGSGQDSSPRRAAEQVVQRAFDAIEAMRWRDVAPLLHPDALRRFRATQLDHARSSERIRTSTHRDPEMPEAVAEWFEKQRQQREAEYGSTLELQFPGIKSAAELEALSSEEMLARWLQAQDPREAFRRELMKKGATPPEVSMEEFPYDRREIVGSVVEDDSTVQVLYRTRVNSDTQFEGEGRIAVATVRRSAQGWGIWLTWRDHQLFDQNSFGFSFADPEENEKRRAEARAKGFAWPAEGTPTVRASVQGDTGGEDPPRTLVIEVRQPNGRMQRVEIPYAALMPLWSYLEPWY